MSNAPLLCVSVAPVDIAACRAELDGCSVAEIRLDDMAVSAPEARSLFGWELTLIATCRPGRHDDGVRRELLIAAIEGGAAYVDVAVDDSPRLRTTVVDAARAKSCKVILSFHDDRHTPTRATLCDIRQRCFDEGADLAKLACQVESSSDAARLLGILDDDRPTVVVGMGPLGRVVRIAAPLLGSPIVYVRRDGGRETAPGQLERTAFERLLREWIGG